ncbi:hypothetical protein CWS01_20690 [Niallia nealsonii]|uniref:DUF5613 domain-containing protein n=1 Tax=Niallia nealsonii TaxID=115979 RepID=A0A2N0YWY5_9BACI|nr:hypothetical protein CWS01_20690 [Niallia nealsonii]
MRTFHQQYNQKHVKFSFPPNEKLTNSLMKYIKKNNYETEMLELYEIKPKKFPEAKQPEDIVVELVNENNLANYLIL